MKLLLENWRGYIKESEEETAYFGKWVDRIPEMYKEWLTSLSASAEGLWEKHGFNKRGEGSFRTVLAPKEDNNFVVKISRTKMYSNMNEAEFELQKKYETLFPRVYFHSPDFRWIVVEAVSPVGLEDIGEWTLWQTAKKEMPNLFEIYIGGVKEWREKYKIKDDDDMYPVDQIGLGFWGFVLNSLRTVMGEDTFGEVDSSKEDIKSYFRSSPDPYFYELAQAVSSNNIALWDLTPQNMGVDSNENLVILDASIEDHINDAEDYLGLT